MTDWRAMGIEGRAQLPVIVEGVSKRFGAVQVVSDLSFEIRAGEVLGFLGPNGAGKTTMMRMILDIIRPDSGRIEVFGGQPGVAQQERIGYLPEERGLYRDVSAVETLTYFGAEGLLRELGLAESLAKKAGELSRGMHQKVQVIATILHRPDLLILDEPFQGLDPVNAGLLREQVTAQRDRGAAVVMSTHDMNEAQALCDRLLLIDRGRRVLYGTLAEIRRGYSSGAVEVVGEAVPVAAEELRSVSEALSVDGGMRYLLRDGASPTDLFRELAAAGAQVTRFEVAEPTLAEIFIRAVAGSEAAGAAA
jgi:ABC-2 type transport system ATP-binding protein